MSQENDALMRRWFEEVWNRRRAEVIEEYVTPESVCHADDGPIRGPDEFRERMHAPMLAAFPDLRVEVVRLVAQDNEVVIRWVATGTHAGEGLGFRATHEKVTIRGITWVCIREGKMMEGWQHSNLPEVLLGLSKAASA
jgi:steroid delta-isomerase-like uncharacterized protein